MSTPQCYCSLYRVLHFVQADCTVLLELVFDTGVVVLLDVWQTACAVVTVEEVFSPANTTDSAAFTMENLLFLIFVVKKVTNGAEVAGKFDFTLYAIFLRFLYISAFQAPYLLHSVSINLMVLFRIHLTIKFHLIVAKPTREKLLALRTSELTLPHIVFTARHRLFCFLIYLLNNIGRVKLSQVESP